MWRRSLLVADAVLVQLSIEDESPRLVGSSTLWQLCPRRARSAMHTVVLIVPLALFVTDGGCPLPCPRPCSCRWRVTFSPTFPRSSRTVAGLGRCVLHPRNFRGGTFYRGGDIAASVSCPRGGAALDPPSHEFLARAAWSVMPRVRRRRRGSRHARGVVECVRHRAHVYIAVVWRVT